MIRPLRPTDYDSLPALQRRAYQVEAALLDTTDFPPLCETLETIHAEAPIGFVHLIDDTIAGAITVDDMTITRLVVEPAYFRQGIARSLLQHLFEHHYAKYVMTGARNLPALALYAQFGFTEVRREWHGAIKLVCLKRN